MTRDQPSRSLFTVLSLLAPPYIVFVYPALSLIRRNPEYFTPGYAAGSQLYVAAGCFLILGVLAWLYRDGRALSWLAAGYLVSGAAWFVYSSIARPFIEHVGVLIVFAALVLGGSAIVRRSFIERMSSLAIADAVLVIGISSSLVFSPSAGAETAAGPQDEGGQSAASTASDLPNIYHVVLDEFQTDLFQASLTDEDRHGLRGFVLFPEATTPYGRTEMSLASTFSSEPYRYDQSPVHYISTAYEDPEGLLGLLRSAGYSTSAYLHSLSVFGGTSPFDSHVLHRHVSATVARHEEAGLLRSMWLYTQLPPDLASQLIPPHHFEQLQGGVLLPDDAPAVSVQSFRAFLRAEASAPAHGRYTFVHLLVPHFPNVLDERCAYSAGTTTAPLEQVSCGLQLISELVEELDRLGRLDDALVIVHGDHGSRYEMRRGQPVNVEPAGHHSEAFSRARSRPLLLIKPPSDANAVTTSSLTSSTRPATLEDLLPTIAQGLEISYRVSGGRAPLLGPTFPSRPVRYYHFYPKDPNRIIDGKLQRFAVSRTGITFDRAIRVPES